jgi:hypothetical protein
MGMQAYLFKIIFPPLDKTSRSLSPPLMEKASKVMTPGLTAGLTGFSKPLPYLLCLGGVFVETSGIRRYFDGPRPEALNNADREIAKGRKPPVIPFFGYVLKKRALGVRAFRVVKVSVTSAVIQNLQPSLHVPCEDGVGRSLD